MKKMDIKENVDNMIFEICKYIKACDLSDKENTEIMLECAMTFLVASIDLTENPVKNIGYIIEQHTKAIDIIVNETCKTVSNYIIGSAEGKEI